MAAKATEYFEDVRLHYSSGKIKPVKRGRRRNAMKRKMKVRKKQNRKKKKNWRNWERRKEKRERKRIKKYGRIERKGKG